MINKIIILFKIAKKIGSSDIIEIIDRTHKIPFFIKFFFSLVSLSFIKKQKQSKKKLTYDKKIIKNHINNLIN